MYSAMNIQLNNQARGNSLVVIIVFSSISKLKLKITKYFNFKRHYCYYDFGFHEKEV